MKPSFYKPKPRWKLLMFITGVTIALHVGGIFWLKDFYFYTKHMIASTKGHLSEDTIDLNQALMAKKNKDLEHIFSRLITKSVLPKDVKFDFKDLDNQFIEDEPYAFSEESTRAEDITLYDPQNDLADYSLPTNEALLDSANAAFESISVDEATYANLQNVSNSMDDSVVNSYVFQQTSLIDHFDSKALLSAVHLNEPTLPSSENPSDSADASESNRAIASSSDFMIDVEYAPKLEEEGFIFKLTLAPKPHKMFKRIKQNIFFLIDRSHSISAKNFQAAKEATCIALDHLHHEDSFNILFFDDKSTKLAPINLPWTPKNVELAKQFLRNQKHGGFFASTDLYSSLNKIIPDEVHENEVNSAILISDGDTYIHQQKQRKTLNFWSQKNRGKVSLFTLAVGKNVNLPLLDLLSVFNKGSLRVAKSSESICKEMVTLVKSLHSPIGKDLVVTALPHHSHATVDTYPTQERLPNLYEHLEYVLYGSIDQGSEFTIFIQGRYYDQWLDIKKSITLSKGTLCADEQLNKGLALQKAYQEYEQFLRSGHPNFLEKAKALLKPVNLPIAFE